MRVMMMRTMTMMNTVIAQMMRIAKNEKTVLKKEETQENYKRTVNYITVQ